MKLVVSEPETEALRAFVEGRRLFSSVIALVELGRATRRYDVAAAGETLAEGLVTVDLDREILVGAVTVEPVSLSSMDAIHVASALTFRSEVEHFVAYDLRLVDAARQAGLPVASPA